MRHAKKGYKLGRTASHRKATLSALSVALIHHKRITTTLTKAKALRMFVEPLITRSRTDTTKNRREIFRHLMDKSAVTELFNEISGRIGNRPGGYTRILRLGQRQGDAAEMAIIELVDYYESAPEESRARRRRRTRRGRRRKSSDSQRAAASEPVAIVSSTKEVDIKLVEDATTSEEVKPDTNQVSPQESDASDGSVRDSSMGDTGIEPIEEVVEGEDTREDNPKPASDGSDEEKLSP